MRLSQLTFKPSWLKPQFLIGFGLIVVSLTFLSFETFDYPIAKYVRNTFLPSNPELKPKIQFLSNLSDHKDYLMLFVGVAMVSYLANRVSQGKLWRRWKGLKSAYQAGWLFLISSGIMGALVMGLKMIVGRKRPYQWVAEGRGAAKFDMFTSDYHYFSLPSGHTATLAVSAIVLSYFYPRWTPLFFLAVITMGATRVLLGWHYVGDVILAIYVAWLAVALALKLLVTIRKRLGLESLL